MQGNRSRDTKPHTSVKDLKDSIKARGDNWNEAPNPSYGARPPTRYSTT